MSLYARKADFVVSDQVGHKQACTVTDECKNLAILDISERGTVLSV